MFCTNCGKQNNPETKFCVGCGNPLNTSPVQETQNVNIQQTVDQNTYQNQQPNDSQGYATQNVGQPQNNVNPVQPKKSNAGKIILIIVAVILIMGIIAVMAVVNFVKGIFNKVTNSDEVQGLINTYEEIGNMAEEAKGYIEKAEEELTENKFNSKPKDVISGYAWEEEIDGPNKALLDLRKDNTFYYYKSKDDLEDNFHSGSYKVYCGEDAIDYIANELGKYSISEEKQRKTISQNGSIDNYYCIALNYESGRLDGDDYWGISEKHPIYAFYNKKTDKLDIVLVGSNAKGVLKKHNK